MKLISKPKFGSFAYKYVPNHKFVFIFVLSALLFLNLTFESHSQIKTSSSVFASSNNSEDQSNPEESTADSNIPIQDDERQEQEPLETPNNLNDPATNDNNPDTNIGLFDSGSINKNILKGKDVSSQNIETAYLIVTTAGTGVVKYFGNEISKELAKTVSVCIETVAEGGSTVVAAPHCMTGLNVTQKFAVEPGQIITNVKNSPQLIADDSYDCPIKYLVPTELKKCLFVFKPTPIEGDITPKSNSDFGKSMIGP